MKYPIFKTKDEITDELLLSTVKEIIEHIYKVKQHISYIEVPLVEDIKITWSKK